MCLEGLLSREASFPLSPPTTPPSQQQPCSQVLPGHQPGERRRLPLRHQQQEGVQGQVAEGGQRRGQEPGAGGGNRRPVPAVRRRTLRRRREGGGGHSHQPQRYVVLVSDFSSIICWWKCVYNFSRNCYHSGLDLCCIAFEEETATSSYFFLDCSVFCSPFPFLSLPVSYSGLHTLSNFFFVVFWVTRPFTFKTKYAVRQTGLSTVGLHRKWCCKIAANWE